MRYIRVLTFAGIALCHSVFGFIDSPTGLAPSSNQAIAVLTPTLQWDKVSGAGGGYLVELAKGRDVYSSNAILTEYVMNNYFAIPSAKGLEPFQTYTWRVTAYESTNGRNPATSLPVTFTTNDMAPPMPTGLAPPDGQLKWPASGAVISWNPVYDAASYTVRWGKNKTQFNAAITSNSYYVLNGLEASTPYYWQVASRSASVKESAYTSWRSFTTIPDVTPATPVLTSPANNAYLSGTTVNLAYNATNALEYQIQVSSTSDFSSDIILDKSNEKGTTYAVTIPTAKYGVKYYWHVQAKAYRLSPWSTTQSFTCNAPSGTMQWPRGSQASVVEPFGPRSSSDPAQWFHTGMNIGPAGGGFKAPYSMVCVLTKLINPDLFRATFKTIDASKEPKYLLFSDLYRSDMDKIDPGRSWNQGGELGVHGGIGNDGYLHMEAYSGSDMSITNGDDADFTNNSDDATYEANRRHARNPIQWLPNSSPGAAVTLDISPNYSPFPTENGVSYFEVCIKSPSPQFGLDKINLSLTNLAGTKSNDLLMVPGVGRISFNDGIGIDRGDGTGVFPTPNLETHPLLGVPGYAIGNDGVKIYTKPFSTGGSKELVFRYYLSSTDVQEIRAEAIGVSGLVLASATRTLAPGCINCGGQGPIPPDILTAIPVTNGVRLRWRASADPAQSTYEYAIYRRRDISTETPKVIAIVPYTNLAYIDSFDKFSNQLLPGKAYRYSIAAIGSYAEGCNGPKKLSCSGSYCPLSCVSEALVTSPTKIYNLRYQGQVVNTALGTMTVAQTITLGQDNFRKPGSATFKAGTIIITDNVTIEDGAPVTLNVTN